MAKASAHLPRFSFATLLFRYSSPSLHLECLRRPRLVAQATIRTARYCDMLVLTNSSFRHVLETHEEMKESMAAVQVARAAWHIVAHF